MLDRDDGCSLTEIMLNQLCSFLIELRLNAPSVRRSGFFATASYLARCPQDRLRDIKFVTSGELDSIREHLEERRRRSFNDHKTLFIFVLGRLRGEFEYERAPEGDCIEIRLIRCQ